MEDLKKPNEGYVEQLYSDAINWLSVVGEYDHRIPKVEGEYSRSIDRTLHFLGTGVADGNIDTLSLLSDLEREAKLAVSESDWITNEEMQDTSRTNQLYQLARVLNSYADHRSET